MFQSAGGRYSVKDYLSDCPSPLGPGNGQQTHVINSSPCAAPTKSGSPDLNTGAADACKRFSAGDNCTLEHDRKTVKVVPVF